MKRWHLSKIFFLPIIILVSVTTQAEEHESGLELYITLSSLTDTASALNQLATEYNFTAVSPSHRLDSLDSVISIIKTNPGPSPSLIDSLRADPRVVNVAPIKNFVVAGVKGVDAGAVSGRSPDPYAPLQHSHDATRVTQSQVYAQGRGVKVAVIDTGIDAMHIDLKNQIGKQLNFVSAGQEAGRMEFHATAVGGIIAAESNNGHGIGGVAPQAKLFALRACVESNPGSSRGKCSSVALARALDWAIVNQMDIVNMSVRGQDDPLVTRLIRKAFEKGLVVVAATDLTNGQLDFPAKLGEVIAVSDQESNSLVGLAAHSQRIFIAPGEEILTTLPNNTYDFVSGASFAAAHVSGIIALLLEKAPTLTPSEVIAVLRESVSVVNWGILVDSCRAFMRLGVAKACQSY